MTLLAYKCMDPSCVHLVRGNHETAAMNKMYGFDGEVKAKYSVKLADLFQEVFQYLPLAVVLGEKVFVVHGGLFSRDGVTLDDLRKIDRFHEPPDSGEFCEMLWSDPRPRARAAAEQTRRGRRIRRRRHEEVFGAQRLGAGGPVARGEGRGVRGGPRRQTDHGVQRAQLLRPDGEQRRVHSVRERHDAALYAV